ncbi:T9SS type A sorting domain-containing protein [Crocinitomix catalasitica]|nr:T9SS type A sorting domain-containing protein [Crocinitomix catalasitica]
MRFFLVIITLVITTSKANAQLAVVAFLGDPVCEGDCTGYLNVMAYGGTPPYTYNWTTGDTTNFALNLCAGTYFVTVSDATGATIVLSVALGNYAPISLTASWVNDPTFNGACDGEISVAIFNGHPSYTLDWIDCNDSTWVWTPSLPPYKFCEGEYAMVAVDECGSSDTSNCVTIVDPLLALPESSQDKLTVEMTNNILIFSKPINFIEIYGLGGQLVFQNNESQIDQMVLPGLPFGIYVLKAMSEDGQMLSQKLIIPSQ